MSTVASHSSALKDPFTRCTTQLAVHFVGRHATWHTYTNIHYAYVFKLMARPSHNLATITVINQKFAFVPHRAVVNVILMFR